MVLLHLIISFATITRHNSTLLWLATKGHYRQEVWYNRKQECFHYCINCLYSVTIKVSSKPTQEWISKSSLSCLCLSYGLIRFPSSLKRRLFGCLPLLRVARVQSLWQVSNDSHALFLQHSAIHNRRQLQQGSTNQTQTLQKSQWSLFLQLFLSLYHLHQQSRCRRSLRWFQVLGRQRRQKESIWHSIHQFHVLDSSNHGRCQVLWICQFWHPHRTHSIWYTLSCWTIGQSRRHSTISRIGGSSEWNQYR